EAEIKKDLKACKKLDKAKNKPQIKCHPTYEKIFNVYNGDTFDRVILPVEGKGLWSTMKGFISLASDGQTVKGLTFYSHGETPGLGGEIDNPNWKKQWINKKVYEVTGKDKRVALNVRKGGAKDADYDVDGLSGATLTSNGVTYLVEFWLGEDGYKPYLDSSGFKGASAGQATPKPKQQAPSPKVQPKEEQPETAQPENSETEKSGNTVEPSEENTQTTDKKSEENTQTTDKKSEENTQTTDKKEE
ncbi:MAG: NADH:ubiquinone reductase (Na(+)-transporting) subunit C, partial [Myxococcota bacterium]|nr:NADH:ubiquinone reductase (Na(+)-transporting) subunit C [Myxococcota bacterium]